MLQQQQRRKWPGAPGTPDYVPFYGLPAASGVDSAPAPAGHAEIPLLAHATKTLPASASGLSARGCVDSRGVGVGVGLSCLPRETLRFWLLLTAAPHPGAQPTVSRHRTFWVNIIFFAKITKRMLCIVYFYTDPNGVPMHDSTGQVLVA